MATETRKPDNDAKVEKEPKATVDEKTVKQDDSNPTKVQLKNLGDKTPDSGSSVGKVLAVLVFVCVAGSAYFLLEGGLVAEPTSNAEETLETKLDLDPSLSARELIQVGRNALDEGDFDEASRFFEGARLRADLESTKDINLTVDVYEGLAQVEAAKGNENVAEMFRDYIHSKQAELGESLPLFNKAEHLFREGKQVEARAQYARFLLLANSLDEAGKRYIEIAKRHVADSFEIEYRERYHKGSTTSLVNPEEFFNEVR
ncbi:MAG: tetratricopeptide (TPR) repeat protein [Planctomycetota bacterium]|jgi:tetratricopeptide (TPR) repeat protein